MTKTKKSAECLAKLSANATGDALFTRASSSTKSEEIRVILKRGSSEINWKAKTIKDEGEEIEKYPYLAWCNKYGMWSDSVEELTDQENDCDGECEDCEFSDWGNDTEESEE